MSNPLRKLLPLKLHTISMALFFTVCLLYLGYGNTSFEIKEFNKLIISQATADGVSIQSRVDLFYALIFKFILLFSILLVVLSLVFSRISLTNQQKSTLVLLSGIGISITIMAVFGIKSKQLIFFLLYLLFHKLLIYSWTSFSKRNLRILKSEILTNSIFSYAFLVYFMVLLLTGTRAFLLIYIVSVVGLSFIYLLLFYRFQWKLRKINQLFKPLIFGVYLVFISVEVSILLKQHDVQGFGYRKMFLLLFLIATLITYLISFAKKGPLNSVSRVFKRQLAPAVIIAFGILLYYFPIVAQNTEMFELGNPANALMNIFKYNEIPFVDFMSSHMFSEQWYGIIYSFIFGYNNYLDFQIYAFFNRLLFLIVVYFVMNKWFKHPAYSLLFILSFPFLTEVFSTDLVFCVLPLFIIQNITKSSTTKQYFYLLASLFLLIVWKIDTGYAALVSSIFFFLILVFTGMIKVNWKHLLKGFVLAFSIVLLLLIIAIALRGEEYILNNFRTALHYVSGNQAHGYTEIAHDYPHQFYISYVILPFVAVFSVLYIIYRFWRKESLENASSNDIFILKSALFFFIVSLANGQRGIVRHGYAENNDGAIITTFYLALSLLIVFLWRNQLKQYRGSLFYGSAFILFIVFRFFPYQPEYGKFDFGIKENAFISLNIDINKEEKGQRTLPNHGFYHNEIKDFQKLVNEQLKENQSFLDFSNSPMLYYYTGKKVPGYFCQNLQNSIDEFTQLQLLNELNPEEFPLVVFSAHPKSWFDQTDGIPNSMRYYLISEYIYQNYEPFVILSNKRIWKAKNYRIDSSISFVKDTLSQKAQLYNYKKAAHFVAQFYDENNFRNLTLLEDWTPPKNERIKISKDLKNYAHVYLSLELNKGFDSSKSAVIQLQNQSGRSLDSFMMEIDPKLGDKYMIRLSNSEHWHNGKAYFIKLDKAILESIKSVSLYQDKNN